MEEPDFYDHDTGWLDDLDDSVSVSASELIEKGNGGSKNKPKPIGEFVPHQTKDAILQLLKGYERVENVDNLQLGTFIRYITLDLDKKQVFRLGGKLHSMHPKYLVIENFKNRWYVKRYHTDEEGNPIFKTVFFRKIPITETLKKHLAVKIKIIEVLRAILVKNDIKAPTDEQIEDILRKYDDDTDAETIITETEEG